MYRDHGFTLVETLVAVVIGVALVVAIGVLGGTLIRHRANADSNSAATSLAQMQLEQLRALDLDDDPDGYLDAGAHGPDPVNESGEPGLGPYQISWNITDNDPALPGTISKRIVVNVSHDYNRFAAAELETYYLVQGYQASGGGGGGTPTETPAGGTPTVAPASTPVPTVKPRPGGRP